MATLGLGLAGCGHHVRTGNISLHVTVSGDAPVSKVDYKLTRLGFEEASGGIFSARPAVSFSRFVSHVPVGEGYLVRVTARSTDGLVTCEGMAKADVRNDATTQVEIALACHGVNDGQIHIVVGIECPWFQVASYTVSPLVASLGGTIAATATTSDTDGGAVTYRWTADTGTFTTPSAAQTTYTCATPGKIGLTVAVSTGPCQASRVVTVTCVDGLDAGAGDDDDAI